MFIRVTITRRPLYLKKKILYVITNKKMTTFSFIASDFKLIPVSEAYTPGDPVRWTVPFHQNGLVLSYSGETAFSEMDLILQFLLPFSSCLGG